MKKHLFAACVVSMMVGAAVTLTVVNRSLSGRERDDDFRISE